MGPTNVAFVGTPEPATAVLFSLGLLGLVYGLPLELASTFGVEARLPVDFRRAAAAAPDQVRAHAEEGITPDDRAALDGLEEEGIGLPFGQLEECGDGGLEVGDQRGIDHLGPPGVISRLEGAEVGGGLHRFSVVRHDLVDQLLVQGDLEVLLQRAEKLLEDVVLQR